MIVEIILKIIVKMKLVICLISLVGIIFTTMSAFNYLNSKSYKVSRLINAVFFDEEFSKFKSKIVFCLDKELLIEKKDNDSKIEYEITNKGFDYMNSQNSLFINYAV